MNQTIVNFWVLGNGERFKFLYDEEVLIKVDGCHYKIEGSVDDRVFFIPHTMPVTGLPQCEEDK